MDTLIIWNGIKITLSEVFEREIPDKEKLHISYGYLRSALGKTPQETEYKGSKTDKERLGILQNAIRRVETILESNASDEEKARLITDVSDPLWGCTDKNADNYDADAIYDDGSCKYTAQPSGGT